MHFHASFAALCFQEIPTLLVQFHVASEHVARSNGFISTSFCRESQKQGVGFFYLELADLHFVYVYTTRDHTCYILFSYLFSPFLLHVVHFMSRDFSGIHLGMAHSLENVQLRRRNRKTQI